MKMIVFPFWFDSNKELHYMCSFLGSRVYSRVNDFMIRHKSYMRVTAVTLDIALQRFDCCTYYSAGSELMSSLSVI